MSDAFIYFIILDACTEVNSLKPLAGKKIIMLKFTYLIFYPLIFYLMRNLLTKEFFIKIHNLYKPINHSLQQEKYLVVLKLNSKRKFVTKKFEYFFN